MAGSAKEQHGLEQQLDMLRQHRRVLTDIANYAARSPDLGSFLDFAVVRVSAALEIDHVKLLRYRSERNDLFMEAGVGWAPGVVRSATFATDLASPVGRAYQTGRPIMIEDFDKSADFRASEVLRAHGIVALLNVPILTDGAVWGVLEADSNRSREFNRDTLNFMVAVASIVGLYIRRVDAEAAGQQAVGANAQELLRRELMLREMHHRVKNNFQVVLSLIEHRKRGLATAGRAAMDRLGEAIIAMSLAHEQLKPTRAGEVLDLGGYLRALGRSFAAETESAAIETKCDEVQVTIEQAVAVGLIVNELVTNSLKHAFDRLPGAIRIELRVAGMAKFVVLTVADNGKGLPGEADKGSGLRLVRALTEQLQGDLEQSSSTEGTTTRLRFAPQPRSG